MCLSTEDSTQAYSSRVLSMLCLAVSCRGTSCTYTGDALSKGGGQVKKQSSTCTRSTAAGASLCACVCWGGHFKLCWHLCCLAALCDQTQMCMFSLCPLQFQCGVQCVAHLLAPMLAVVLDTTNKQLLRL